MRLAVIPLGVARFLKKCMPQTLFRRTILIIVLPMMIALTTATFVFFDHLWQRTTRTLAASIAADIVMAQILLAYDAEVDDAGTPETSATRALITQTIDIKTTCSPTGRMPNPARVSGVTSGITPAIRAVLKSELQKRLDGRPFVIDMTDAPKQFAIYTKRTGENGFCKFTVPWRRLATPKTGVFVAWMLGSSLGLTLIALLFLRNQIRPVRRLAEAAQALGRGEDVPWFHPSGAIEVRQAAEALLDLHQRLRQQITQHTLMLAGISHDLRTPLARMRLEAEMMADGQDTQSLKQDIATMEAMLSSYLTFARGEDGETKSDVDVRDLIVRVCEDMMRYHPVPPIVYHLEEEVLMVRARPQALRRCLENILSNARRHGTAVWIACVRTPEGVILTVEDNGVGIAAEDREVAFRPFVRLDQARNSATGGTGLGLAIARNIVEAHGGTIGLSDSLHGGLRVTIVWPSRRKA